MLLEEIFWNIEGSRSASQDDRNAGSWDAEEQTWRESLTQIPAT